MMKIYKTFALIILVSLQVFGEEAQQFEIDNDLVEQIYKESSGERPIENSLPSAGFTVAPQLGFFIPSEMKLTNNYFEVPYSNFGSLPTFSVNATKILFSLGSFNLRGAGGVGYSYKEGTVNVLSKTGGAQGNRTSQIRLHSLPLFMGPQIEFAGIQSVKPFISLQAGAQWLYQVGTLDGLEQGFWVPFYELGFGVTLFEAASTRDAWFGGLTIAALKRTSFSSDQIANGWNVNLGAKILF